MSVFSSKPKRKYTKKPPATPESVLNKVLVNVLTKNPEYAERLALKKFGKQMGIEDMGAETDPAEQARKEIQATVLKQTLEEIKNNPSLRTQLAQKQAEDIFGSTSKDNGEEPDGYSGGSSIGQLMEEMEQYEELRNKLGGGNKGGALGGLIDKDTINGILALLVGMQRNKAPEQARPQERMVLVVTPDGALGEVAESHYLDLYKKGELRPVAALGPPKKQSTPEDTAITAQTQEPGMTQGPGIDDLLSVISLQEIEEFANYTPEELVQRINEELTEGVARASLLKTLLQTITYEQVVQYVSPYKDNEKVGQYVQKLLTPEGKQWCEQVLDLIKNEKIG